MRAVGALSLDWRSGDILETLYITVNAVILVISAWLLVTNLHYVFVSFWGYKKPQPYPKSVPKTRFLVLIPSKNEEKVISDIIASLDQTDYPKELVDVYVIADNCTDQTERLARDAGANVLSFTSVRGEPCGKPHAIRKALDHLGDITRRYDMLMIFDADNLVESNIFTEVNSQFVHCGRPDVIQCYLGCKNRRGLVALAYYVAYTSVNRFFQLAKHNLGINASIGGTGFAMSTDCLRRLGGFQVSSLTEDFEMQIRISILGGRILWNHHTRVYDEKPTSLRASYRQRRRWCQGHWFVALKKTRALFASLRQGTISKHEFFFTLVYMYSMPRSIMVPLILLSIPLSLAVGQPIRYAAFLFAEVSINPVSLFAIGYAYFFLFWVADRMDNGNRPDPLLLPVIFVAMFVNNISYTASQVAGFLLMRRQHVWVKTEHRISEAEAEIAPLDLSPAPVPRPREVGPEE